MSSGNTPASSTNNAEPLRLRFGDFELQESDARLLRDQRAIALPPRAFAVLCALARQAGKLVTKTALLDTVWGHQHVSESVLKTVISELRDALSDDPKAPRIIETVPRRGYRFIALTGAAPPAAQSIAGASPRSAALVGRSHDMARLQEAWERAGSGQRQVVWVVGEPGIGKTTLVEHFLGCLGSVRYAYGQCVEQHGTAEPYLPILEALGALCRNDPSLSSLLRQVAPTWLLQMPWLIPDAERDALLRELVSVGQERMLREFGELLSLYTSEQPLLLVTEDLHWSDQATVNLLSHFSRRRNSTRVMWLGTFRLAEVIASEHSLKPLRQELRLHGLCDEVILEPLSENDVANYLALRFPGAFMTESIVRELHDRTEGLPLFLVNVVDDLARRQRDANSVSPLAPGMTATLRIPGNIAGAIEKQAERLPADAQTLLQAASIYGIEFAPAAVAEMIQRDAGWVEAYCEQLSAHGQWLASAQVARLPDGALEARYAFRHALYRHVLYQGIGSLRRAQWHGRAALTLARRRGTGASVSASELAIHHELSLDFIAAFAAYAEAAHNAMRRFAPGEGLMLARRGLDLLPRCAPGAPRDALELTLTTLRGAAAAQSLGVGSAEAKASFERARELLQEWPRHPMRGLALHALGIVLLVRGEYAQAICLGEEIRRLAGQEVDSLLLLSACSVLGQAHALQGRHGPACALLAEGVSACVAVGDEALGAAFVVDPAVTLYAAIAIPLLHLGRIDEARAHLDIAMARARRLREPMALLVAHWFGALFALRLEEVDEVAELATGMARLAEEAALPQGVGPSQWFGGWAQAHGGDARDAFHRIRSAHALNVGIGMHSGSSEVLAYAAEALVLAGDWDAAARQLDEALAAAHTLGEEVYLTPMHLLRARIAIGQGNVEAGCACLRYAAELARAQDAPWLELGAWVALCERPEATGQDYARLRDTCRLMLQGLDTHRIARARRLVEDPAPGI